jgi:hypothetical protein
MAKSKPKPKVLRKVRVRRIVAPPTPGAPVVLELEVHAPPPLPAEPIPVDPIELDEAVPVDEKKHGWGGWLRTTLFGE